MAITKNSPEFLNYVLDWQGEELTPANIDRLFPIFLHDECFKCEQDGKHYMFAEMDQTIWEDYDAQVHVDNAADWIEELDDSNPYDDHLNAYDFLPRSVFA